jgi:glycosyltransferase involved in cell wall biosynthesis
MKILIAAFSFPPNLDGVAMAAATMASGFADAGHQVTILTTPVVMGRETKFWRNLPVHEFIITGRGQIKRPYGGEIREYQKFLLSGAWDVIIFHSYEWPLRLALEFMDSLPGKKVLVSHGHSGCQWVKFPRFPWGLGVWTNNLWDAVKMVFWVRKIDHVVYLSKTQNFSEFFDHLLIKWSGYRKYSVIPNGVLPVAEALTGASFREKYDIHEDTFVFLCVANYSRRKDQGFAARAYRQAKISNSILIFIGTEFNESSDLFQKDDSKCDTHSTHGRILWLEKQTREDTLKAFKECDVFVLSSNHEGLPIEILEAMRECKPWISRRSGCVDSIPGGLIIKTECEMACAMQRIAGSSQVRHELGESGSSAARSTYNLDCYVKSYIELLSSLVVKS